MLSNLGPVIVACSEREVFDHIVSIGGKAEMTDPNLPSGTDRVYQAVKNYANINQIDSIINLQGDMPLINPKDIEKVTIPLNQGFDIGTLVTDLKENQLDDNNITKAKISWINKFKIGKALDFSKNGFNLTNNDIYHHVGIYSFRYEILKKFVSLEPSKNEISKSLEQLRALDAKMTIGVSYVKNIPISVDTVEDLLKIENIIKILE
jgi:3-deoxy-manno-octulosonate cytidylyltransferase (CMP-KDO synthetase)